MKTITLEQGLAIAEEQAATDAHFADRKLWLRIAGVLRPMPDVELAANFLEAARGNKWFNADKWTDKEADFYAEHDGRDLRCHLWTVGGERVLAVRLLKREPPLLEKLGVPGGMIALANAPKPSGLLLVTGATGSGKSTTLGSFIRHLNEKPGYGRHIITLEDPIEYRHRSQNCLINQREIGRDTRDFAHAMRCMLREDPDILFVGEMRDIESIRLAIYAAETGHFVFSTMHSSNAPRTITRILDETPEGAARSELRAKLAASLIGICSQCLPARRVVQTKGEDRIAAFEFMRMTPAVRGLIADGKVHMLAGEVLKGDRQGDGSADMTMSLARLVKSGAITLEEAKEHAMDPAQVDERIAELTTRRG